MKKVLSRIFDILSFSFSYCNLWKLKFSLKMCYNFTLKASLFEVMHIKRFFNQIEALKDPLIGLSHATWNL